MARICYPIILLSILFCGYQQAKTPEEAFKLAVDFYQKEDTAGLMSQMNEESLQNIREEFKAFKNNVKKFPDQAKAQIAEVMKISVSSLDSFDIADYFRYKINLDESQTQTGFTATLDKATIKSKVVKQKSAVILLEVHNEPKEGMKPTSELRKLYFTLSPQGWKLNLFSHDEIE